MRTGNDRRLAITLLFRVGILRNADAKESRLVRVKRRCLGDDERSSFFEVPCRHWSAYREELSYVKDLDRLLVA